MHREPELKNSIRGILLTGLAVVVPVSLTILHNPLDMTVEEACVLVVYLVIVNPVGRTAKKVVAAL